MTTHRCIVYGLTGSGSRLVIEVSNVIDPCVDAPKANTVRVETVSKTRAKQRPSLNIKPTNGNRLALR